MPALRVVLATDWYLPRTGGIELQVADLARELRVRGHRVRVLTTTPAHARDVEPHEEAHRLAALRLPGAGVAIDPRLIASVERILRDDRCDVVHAHVSVASPLAYAAVVAARRLTLPCVVTFHSVLHASAWLLAAADTLVGWTRGPLVATAVSGMVAAQLDRALGRRVTTVLPNGVDRDRWRAASSGRVGRDARELRLVSTMRLHRKKRPLALVDAVATAQRRLGDAVRLSLTIHGDGPERAGVERRVRRLALDDRITLAGRTARESLPARYAEADAFVLPTVREAFGIAALEARCAGLPVIAMSAGGATDFLRHGENALLAHDDDALAVHIERLARDQSLRERLARWDDTPLARWAWSAVATVHEATYERAMALAGRASSSFLSASPS